MHTVDLMTDVAWLGAVELERGPDGSVIPWRLPHSRRDEFADEVLLRARMPAGVRMSFATDARLLEMDVVTTEEDPAPIDIVTDGRHLLRCPLDDGRLRVDLPADVAAIEIWLPHFGDLTIGALRLDSERCTPVKPKQRCWITHGSSITQCRTASGPLETWPALTARALDRDLLCLGFGGQCLLDPMVARLIRDTPAELVSLCLGINVYGQATHNARSLLPAVLGFIATVLDGHDDVPMLIISPIEVNDDEDPPNDAGLRLTDIRSTVARAVEILSSTHPNLHYLDGRELLSAADRDHFADRVHPDSDGYRLMAERLTPVLAALQP